MKEENINKIRKAIEEEKLVIKIEEVMDQVMVGLSAPKDSPYFGTSIDPEKENQINSFMETYKENLRKLYKLHTEENNETVEWCYKVGKVLSEGLSERTNKEKEAFIKPLEENLDEDIFSKWKIFQTQSVYELYPNKQALPEIDLDGSVSVFLLTCQRADNYQQVNKIYNKLDTKNFQLLEHRAWKEIEENADKQKIKEKIDKHANKGASKERKEKATQRVHKITN